MCEFTLLPPILFKSFPVQIQPKQFQSWTENSAFLANEDIFYSSVSSRSWPSLFNFLSAGERIEKSYKINFF